MALDLSKYTATTTKTARSDLSKYGAPVDEAIPDTKTNDLLSRITQALNARASQLISDTNASAARFDPNATDALSTFVEKPAIVGQAVGNVGKAVAQGAGDIAGIGISEIGRATGLDKFIGALFDQIANVPGVKDGASKLKATYEALDPDVRTALDQAFATFTLGGGAKVAQPIERATLKGAETVVRDVTEGIGQSTPPTSSIVGNYSKGIKPSTRGLNTASQALTREQQILRAGETIVDNRLNLKLFDDAGVELPEGTLPQSIRQFNDAIGQTKQRVFEMYDALAKKASSKVGVKTDAVIKELEKVAYNETLNDFRPDVARYAKERIESLKTRGEYSTTQAQEAIKLLNQSLDAFYRNPTYDNATRASIDALIVNNLRKELDSVIENATGDAGYQELKSQYAALKAIEKDVLNASLRDAKRNTAGVVDYFDILSGGQLVNGLLTLNPASIASGAAQKGIQQYIKFLNDPNRAVKLYFEQIERTRSASKSAGQGK